MLLMLATVAALSAPAAAQDNRVGVEGPSTLVHPPYRHTYGIHKARTPHLRLFLGGRTVFANPQGLAAVKLAEDDDPDIRGDDFQLTVLGLNAGRGEIIYNSSMQTLALYGTHGSREGQFDGPRSIAADVHGNVYIADTGNRRVVRLVWRGRQLEWAGLVPGQFQEPWGVSVAPPGRAVYVSDRAANQVFRWMPAAPVEPKTVAPSDLGGSGDTAVATTERGARGAGPLSSSEEGARAAAGGQLEPVFPEGLPLPTALVVVDSQERWLATREDALFVIYEDGARLGKFDPSGRLLAATAAADRDSLRAPPRFAFVAADFYGNVYVTDTGNGTIYKFKSDLTFLTSYGEQGTGDYQLDEPRGIAIWKRFGQVLVAEKEGAQYFFVGTDVRLPEGEVPVRLEESAEGRRYVLDAFFTEPTELSLAFLSASGAVVDSLTLDEPVDSGAASVSVDASRLAADLPQRASRIVLEPRPTYSSRKRFARRIERGIDWILPS